MTSQEQISESIQKEQDEICHLLKNSLLVYIGEDIKAKYAPMICMESSEQTGAYISSPICTYRTIFGMGTFFVLFFLNLLINPATPQVWIFVTSNFSFLYLNVWKSTVVRYQ